MIGFGIIGCGTISTWHAEGVRVCEGARLAGVCDVRADAAKAFGEKWGCNAYSSLEAMLASPDVDAVSICTPSGLHALQAMAAIKAGKHVLIEKPMALNIADSDALIEAADRMGVKAGVVSQYRFAKSYKTLKAAIEAGKLGRLVTGDVFMKYFRSREYYALSSWRGTWAMDGGGALMNQGIHGIDSLLSLMGPVKHVYGLARTLCHDIEVEDTASAVLEFECGALGMIQGTTSVYPGFPRRLSVSGTRGTITITENLFTEWAIKDEELPEGVELGGNQRSGASEPTNFDLEGHRLHIFDMVDAIVGGREPAVTLPDARRAIETITAIYESSQTGKRVTLG